MNLDTKTLKDEAQRLIDIQSADPRMGALYRHEYLKVATPEAVLALIAENERLTGFVVRRRSQEDQYDAALVEVANERDQLRAEVAGLKTGYEAYERVNAELKAQNEALRKGAARYEWLRQARSGYIEVVEWIGPHATGMTGEDLDALLDAAMGKGGQS